MLNARYFPGEESARRTSASFRCLCLFAVLLAGVISGCVSPPPTPVAAPVATPAPSPAEAAPPAPAPAPPPVAPPSLPPSTVATAAPKEAPPVELPSYAKRGKRLPADGGAAGRAVISYCRSFEVDKDAATYFKRLQREKRLPTDSEIGERNRQHDQSLSVQQHVERDWALRRDNNKSVPQRCNVLGGSSEGATAHIVFEADLNGRRQRGTATVTLANGQWRLRDHGDWSPARKP